MEMQELTRSLLSLSSCFPYSVDGNFEEGVFYKKHVRCIKDVHIAQEVVYLLWSDTHLKSFANLLTCVWRFYGHSAL